MAARPTATPTSRDDSLHDVLWLGVGQVRGRTGPAPLPRPQPAPRYLLGAAHPGFAIEASQKQASGVPDPRDVDDEQAGSHQCRGSEEASRDEVALSTLEAGFPRTVGSRIAKSGCRAPARCLRVQRHHAHPRSAAVPLLCYGGSVGVALASVHSYAGCSFAGWHRTVGKTTVTLLLAPTKTNQTFIEQHD